MDAGHALSVDPALAIADSSAQYGAYQTAITEYKRYLFFHTQPDSERSLTLFKLAQSYRQINNMEEAIRACRESIQICRDVGKRDRRTLRLCLWYIEFHHDDLAETTLREMTNEAADSPTRNKSLLLTFLLQAQKGEWSRAVESLEKFRPADALETEIQKNLLEILDQQPRTRSPALAGWLSTCVPGSGQIYAGDYRNGLNAFILNSLVGYQTVRFVMDEKYAGAFMTGRYLFWRYYSGNRYHAARLAGEYNRRESRCYQLRLFDCARPLFMNQKN